MTVKSYKAEVTTDATGQWTGNACRFATQVEAEKYVLDLMMRWTAVRDTRVIESEAPPNYRWVDGKGVEVLKPAP